MTNETGVEVDVPLEWMLQERTITSGRCLTGPARRPGGRSEADEAAEEPNTLEANGNESAVVALRVTPGQYVYNHYRPIRPVMHSSNPDAAQAPRMGDGIRGRPGGSPLQV